MSMNAQIFMIILFVYIILSLDQLKIGGCCRRKIKFYVRDAPTASSMVV